MVTFSALRNIAWLQGGGYDIVHVEVPVHFKGEKDDFKAFFEPVLWEDVPDAILTGREQLGYSKLFGFIKTMDELDGISRGSIAAHDFTFLDMQLRVEEEPENLDTLEEGAGQPGDRGQGTLQVYAPYGGALPDGRRLLFRLGNEGLSGARGYR